MYSWDIDTEDTWGNILLLVFVGCVIGICLLPVWPSFLKLTLYYILLAYMIIFLGVLIIRYLLWFICWPFGYSVWIFPRLNDDVGLKESFQPFITCKKSKTATLKRLIIFGSVIAGFYYIFFHYNVSGFVQENKQFMEDIYNGRLLDMFSANSFYDKADGVKQTNGKEGETEEEHKSTTWSKSKHTDVDDIPKDDHPEDWEDEPEEEDQEAALNRMGARVINPDTYSDEQYKADMEYYSKKDEEMEKQYEREEKERQRQQKIKEEKEREKKEKEAQRRWEKREKERLERLEREKQEKENEQELEEEEL